jgi:hypothetical protein
MKEIINIQGKWYNLIDMFGGRVFVSGLFDTNNDLMDINESNCLWEMQPFFYEKERWYGSLLKRFAQLIRCIIQLVAKRN